MQLFSRFMLFVLVFGFVTAPVSAETQSVRVSGSLDIYWIYMNNMDLRDGNDIGVVPAGSAVPNAPVTSAAADAQRQSGGADWFMSIAQIQVAADLTDNVSMTVNLFNQRDWNQGAWAVNTAVANNAAEFDVGVDLAYVELREAFYEPLTITIGRQDFEDGRGLIFGDQPQDVQGSVICDEMSAVTSFDAFRAVLDFDPWTIDLVAAMPVNAAGSANAEDDRTLWWVNLHYDFPDLDAVWEGYAGLDHDRSANAADPSDAIRSNSVEKTFLLGTRAQFDPVENLTLGGEAAVQLGDYYGGSNVSVNPEADREAVLLNVFGEYRWEENEYKPYFGLEYIRLDGDNLNGSGSETGDFEGWTDWFHNGPFGLIYNELEANYATALAGDDGAGTNHEHLAISAGLAPMDDVSLDGIFYFMWTDEDVFSTTAGAPYNVGDEAGTELDLILTYAYTEDVTFTTELAWFWPGSLYDNAPEAAGQGPLNDTAMRVVAGVSTVF